MKDEYVRMKISGKQQLRFTAAMNAATGSLSPTDANVKSAERIDLAAKEDKLGAKASRKAIRQLLDFPNHLAEPQTGAKLLGLVMSAQAAPLYVVQAGTPLPSVQITGMLRLPESVGNLLRAIQGSEKWSGDGWHLRRPWLIQPLIRIGATSLETNTYRYVGAKAVQPYGPRVKFWAPYADCAVAFAPDLPAPVRKAILKASPLTMPISASAADRQLVVKLAVNELAYRSPDDVPALRDASPVVRRFVCWLEKGGHAQRWVDAIRANGGGHSCPTAHGERELWISVLALITLFLDWATRKAELLTEEETAVLKERFVDWLHPDGPQTPVDGAVDLAKAETFYRFLVAYLGSNANRVIEGPGHADTLARIHIVNKTTPRLTLPRAATFEAYAAGGEAPTDVDLQRALMAAGVPLRTEGKDTSWRYAFYARGQAPQGQSDKLPCLSLPLAELPHEVLSQLTSLFGNQFGSILPTTGEDIAPEAKIGGKI